MRVHRTRLSGLSDDQLYPSSSHKMANFSARKDVCTGSHKRLGSGFESLRTHHFSTRLGTLISADFPPPTVTSGRDRSSFDLLKILTLDNLNALPEGAQAIAVAAAVDPHPFAGGSGESPQNGHVPNPC